MDRKISVWDLECFMERYIPPPSNKKEPNDLSILKWSGPLSPENMDVARATVRGFHP